MKELKFVIRFLLLFILLNSGGAMAQVTQAEYFIDTDPGQGSANPMVATDGSLNSVIESVMKNGINIATTGKHIIGIRIKDVHGTWGPVFKTVVSVENTLTVSDIKISQAELFWDTDPGLGSGTPMIAFDGSFNNAIETLLKSGAAIPTAGRHKLCIRVKDANTWGPIFSTVISIENITAVPDIHIVAGEYFWGNDPGIGNGIALLALDGNFNQAVETVMKNNITLPATGIKKFSVRVKDLYNNWGPVFSTIVSVENIINPRNIKVALAEYFWDIDPGQGSGMVMLAFDGNYNQAIETAYTAASLPLSGKHKFNVRAKGANGTWGPVFTTIISIENQNLARSTHVKSGEMFWDSDPGLGNGISFFAFDGNFNDAYEIISKSTSTFPSNGIHKLNVRIKDANNTWGPVFSKIVSIENPSVSRTISINLAEVFWDTDPGFGAGIPVLAFDGNYNDAVEKLKHGLFTGFLSIGKHKLCFRAQGKDGNWSPVFTSVVFIDPCVSSPVPTITAGITTICEGDSIALTASAGYNSYRWMRGSTQLTDTTRILYAKTSGYYKVIVTDNNGCPGVSSATIINVIPVYPNITAIGSTTFCQGGSVVLDAGNTFDTYQWSNGANTSSISVSLGGAYSVTVTNDGCTRISPTEIVTVNPNPAMPTITADGPLAFCLGDSVKLTSSTASSYLWSNGDTSRTVTAYSAGTFIVNAYNSFGCHTSSVPTTVTVTSSNPNINVIGSLNICDGDEVILDAGGGYTNYLWSTGETTQMISATTSGSYAATVTNVACVGQTVPVSVSVYPKPIAPSITPLTATTFCENDSVILVSSSLNYNTWSTGDTTSFIVVYNSGNYTVSIHNGFGCINTSGVIPVNVIPINTTLTITGNTQLCQGDTVIISAPAGYDAYAWSNGSTSSFIKVNSGGTYNVTITNLLCTKVSDNITVTVNPLPSVPTISQIGSTPFCEGDSIILTSSSSYAYYWSNGETSQSINVKYAGSYSVVTSNAFGCSSVSSPIAVTAYSNPIPDVLYTGMTTFCDGDSIVLTSSVSSGNLWSTGETSQMIAVYQTGVYSVMTLTSDGCHATSDTLHVTVTVVNPVIASSGPTAFCQGNNVVLDAGPLYDSYQWSTGETGQTITALVSDDYSVTVSLNSCERESQPVTVTVFSLPATPVITALDTTTFCDGDSVLLTTDPANSYVWSNGDTVQTATIYNAGCYSVLIYDVNGCSMVSSCENIVVKPSPNIPIISVNGQNVFCEGDSVMLTSTVESEYLWSTGDTTRDITISQTGLFNVIVTNTYGCPRSSQNVSITVHPAQPQPLISYVGMTVLCNGDSIILTSTPAEEYMWSTGQSTPSITVSTGGSYFVEAINFYGCTATSDLFPVTVHPKPSVPTIVESGPTTFCLGDSVKLISSVNYSYYWSTGDTTRLITVTSSGDYFVTVYNSFGCSEVSDTTTVVSLSLPSVPVITQNNDSLISTPADSYQWYLDGVALVNGTSQSIHAYITGNYYVIVTNANGCQNQSITVFFIGVEDLTQQQYSISVYPNPLSDYTTFHVEVPNNTYDYDLYVMDLLGKVVIQEQHVTSDSYLLNASELTDGMYIYKIISDKKEIGTGKLIVKSE